jgi:hypothetical protein
LRCHKAQPTVGTGKFLHELVPEFHDKPALIDIEKAVEFRLVDWLLKGDAGEHFGGREIKTPLAPLCSLKYAASALIVDL